MTSFTPICSYCKHFDLKTRDKEVCAAFPSGIPAEVLKGRNNHRTPIEGDHGVQFDPVEGFEHLTQSPVGVER